jgi:hypothetical protein
MAMLKRDVTAEDVHRLAAEAADRLSELSEQKKRSKGTGIKRSHVTDDGYVSRFNTVNQENRTTLLEKW